MTCLVIAFTPVIPRLSWFRLVSAGYIIFWTLLQILVTTPPICRLRIAGGHAFQLHATHAIYVALPLVNNMCLVCFRKQVPVMPPTQIMQHFHRLISILFTLGNWWISFYATHAIYAVFQKGLLINIQHQLLKFYSLYWHFNVQNSNSFFHHSLILTACQNLLGYLMPIGQGINRIVWSYLFFCNCFLRVSFFQNFHTNLFDPLIEP